MTDKQRFLEICNTEIKREGLSKLLDWLEKSDFYEAPASTKYHGNYAGGLLKHSLNVYDCLKRIASNYENKNISGESIADREEIKKVLARLEDPAVVGVLVVEPSRLSRGDLADCAKIINSFRFSKRR